MKLYCVKLSIIHSPMEKKKNKYIMDVYSLTDVVSKT